MLLHHVQPYLGPEDWQNITKALLCGEHTKLLWCTDDDLRVHQLQLLLLFFKDQDLLVEEAVVLAPLATAPNLPVLLAQLCSRLLRNKSDNKSLSFVTRPPEIENVDHFFLVSLS